MTPFRVALLGAGTVGRATADLLLANRTRLAAAAGRTIELAAIAARTPGRLEGLALPEAVIVTADPAEAAAMPGVDAIVELLGGLEPAGGLIVHALAVGRSVVTANKHLLADRGAELEAAARRSGARLRFEAAVGGGTPVLRVCAADLAGVRIDRVRGVVNGTTNWILDAMERDGLDAGAALRAAQAAGYAEADPSFDLDGIDAADKIVVLARLAFGAWLSPAAVVRAASGGPGAARPGISGVDAAAIAAAGKRDRRVRLVAEAHRGPSGVTASVVARELPLDDPLAGARGVRNVIVFEGEPIGTVTVAGPGAGGPQTATAVVADLVALARGEGSTWSEAAPATAAVA